MLASRLILNSISLCSRATLCYGKITPWTGPQFQYPACGVKMHLYAPLNLIPSLSFSPASYSSISDITPYFGDQGRRFRPQEHPQHGTMHIECDIMDTFSPEVAEGLDPQALLRREKVLGMEHFSYKRASTTSFIIVPNIKCSFTEIYVLPMSPDRRSGPYFEAWE